MSRATSYNAEIEIDGGTIHPMSIGEYSEGEEGKIEVTDGNIKYKIRDQIYSIEEVETEIYIHDDKRDYDIMQNWVKSGLPKDIYIIYRNGAGERMLEFLFKGCELSHGKKNAFDRNSKAADSKKYSLIPKEIIEVEI